MLIWGVFFAAFVFFGNRGKGIFLEHFPSVSVVICARNEAENLKKNLQFVLNQNFKSYEVIVVNDCSGDETSEVLKDYQKKFSNLRILELIEKKGNGKKYVLLEGLKAAKYEWILLTDADCMPFSKDWISSMLSAVQNEKTEIVLGFAPYWDRKSLLAKWIDFETCYTALQYFSAAFWRIPYMGVGRNLLFKRSFFKDYENTIQKNSLSSGDDDLFVNAVANAENTEICMQKDSFMYSEPKKTLKELYIQKTRHYSAGTHYKLKHQILLSGVFLSHIFFWIFCFAGLIFSPVYSILPLILRLTIIFLIWKKFLFIFGKRKLLSYILFFDFFLVVYYLIFSPSLLFFKNKNKWN